MKVKQLNCANRYLFGIVNSEYDKGLEKTDMNTKRNGRKVWPTNAGDIFKRRVF